MAEIRIVARYVVETRQNAIEAHGGAPALYVYVNHRPLQAATYVPAQSLIGGARFAITLRLPANARFGALNAMLGIQAFAETTTEDSRRGYIHAGSAVTYLAPLLGAIGGTVENGDNPQLRINLLIRGRTTKGHLLVDLYRSSVRYSTNPHAIGNSPRLRIGERDISNSPFAYEVAIRTCATLLRQWQAYAFSPLEARPPSFALAKEIRVKAWQSPNMAEVPFASFLTPGERVRLDPHYWHALFHTILGRHHLDETAFRSILANISKSREATRRVGRVLADMLTGYVTAIPYLTDFIVTRRGRRRVTEFFDRVRLRWSNDCEDLCREMFLLFQEFTDKTTVFAPTSSLAHLQRVARHYVCAATLGAVTTQRLIVDGGGGGGGDDDGSMGAHMWVMLVPAHTWHEWRTGRPAATAWGVPDWMRAHAELLVLEGTGHMDAIVGSFEAPTPPAREVRAATAIGHFLSRHSARLSDMTRTVSLVDAYDQSLTTGETSPFYRKVTEMMVRLPGVGVGGVERIEQVAVIDGHRGSHGVGFNGFSRYAHGSFALRLMPLAPLPGALARAANALLSYACPEPALRTGSLPLHQSAAVGALLGIGVHNRAIHSRDAAAAAIAAHRVGGGEELHPLHLYFYPETTVGSRARFVSETSIRALTARVAGEDTAVAHVAHAHEIYDDAAAGNDSRPGVSQHRVTLFLRNP
jgi:hypothetical protein